MPSLIACHECDGHRPPHGDRRIPSLSASQPISTRRARYFQSIVLTTPPGHGPGDEPPTRTMARTVIDNVARRNPQLAGEIAETRNPCLQVAPELRQDLAFMVLNRPCGQAACFAISTSFMPWSSSTRVSSSVSDRRTSRHFWPACAAHHAASRSRNGPSGRSPPRPAPAPRSHHCTYRRIRPPRRRHSEPRAQVWGRLSKPGCGDRTDRRAAGWPDALKQGFIAGLPVQAQVKDDDMTGFSLNADEVVN